MPQKFISVRNSRLLSGGRPPLPGQDSMRETELRAKLIKDFVPEGCVEMIWVEDIAHCMAAIEVIRAQIAGFRMCMVRGAYKRLNDTDDLEKDFSIAPDEGIFSAFDRNWLDSFAESGFYALPNKGFLDHESFAGLLGSMTRVEIEHMRRLQMCEHDEMRERDRIINQFDRRRRQAMRDAIELAEARRRAAMSGEVSADQAQDAAAANASDMDSSAICAIEDTGEGATHGEVSPTALDKTGAVDAKADPAKEAVLTDAPNADLDAGDAGVALPPMPPKEAVA